MTSASMRHVMRFMNVVDSRPSKGWNEAIKEGYTMYIRVLVKDQADVSIEPVRFSLDNSNENKFGHTKHKMHRAARVSF